MGLSCMRIFKELMMGCLRIRILLISLGSWHLRMGMWGNLLGLWRRRILMRRMQGRNIRNGPIVHGSSSLKHHHHAIISRMSNMVVQKRISVKSRNNHHIYLNNTTSNLTNDHKQYKAYTSANTPTKVAAPTPRPPTRNPQQHLST